MKRALCEFDTFLVKSLHPDEQQIDGALLQSPSHSDFSYWSPIENNSHVLNGVVSGKKFEFVEGKK